MEIDNVFQEIGQSGRQQIKYGIILCLYKVYTPFMVLQYTFVGRSSTFYCSHGKKTLTDKCFHSVTSGCSNLTHSEPTILAEWGLVCDRNWLSKATMSSLMLGFLLGALVLGDLADRIGRKRNLVLTMVGVILANLVSASTADYSVYLFSRFLVGFFISGNILSVVVLTSELVGPAYRGIYGLAVMGSFPVGLILLSVLASHLLNWRLLTACVSLLGLPLLWLSSYLVESPRWYLSKDLPTQAEQVLVTIGRGNGVTGRLDFNLRPSGLKTEKKIGSSDSILRLFTSPRLLGVTLILLYNWFVNGASYYGMTLAAGSIGTDIYTGAALSGLVEIPAVLFTYLGIQHAGRRLALATFMLLSGASCLAVQLCSVAGGTATSLALFGKMNIAASFKAAYILSGEIFSTSIRNSAMGLASAFARLGAILAPFIVMAGETIQGLEFTVFAILGLTGGFLSLWLPETKDLPLPESVSEMLIDKSKKLDLEQL